MENRDQASSSLGGLVGLLSMLVVTVGAVFSGLTVEEGSKGGLSDSHVDDLTAVAPDNQGKVPEWFRRTVLWYGQGRVSEREFLDAIAYLIDKDLIVLDQTAE